MGKEKVPNKKYFCNRLKIILDNILKILSILLIIVPLSLFIYIVCLEKNKNIVLVDNFEVADKLQELGYTQRTLISKLYDQITNIIYSAKTTYFEVTPPKPVYLLEIPTEPPGKIHEEPFKITIQKNIYVEETNKKTSNFILEKPQIINLNEVSDIELKIAGTEIPLKAFIYFLKNYIGVSPIHIAGEITLNIDLNQLNLTIRVIEKLAITFTESLGNLDASLPKVAEYLCKFIEPSALAFYLYRNNRIDECLNVIKYSLENDSSKDTCFSFFLWGIILENQNLDEAIIKYESAIKKNHKFAEAYYKLAVILHNQNKYEPAIHNFNKAYKYGLKYATSFCAITYNNWGNSFANQEKYDEAIEKYRMAVIHDPQCASAYHNWGDALYRQKEYDYAIEMYKKAINFNPRISSYFNMGIAYHDKQEFDQAINIYKKIIDLDPNFPYSYYYLGLIYTTIQKYKNDNEAIQMFKKTIKVAPKYESPYYSLSDIFYSHGNYLEAIKNFRCYKKDNKPDIRYSFAFNNWGIILYNQGKLYRAIKMFKKATRFDPQNKEAYHNLKHIEKSIKGLKFPEKSKF